MGIPQLTGVAHLAFLREVLDDFGCLTHHHPLSGDDGAALRAATEESDCEHDKTTDRGDAGDQRHTDSHAGSLRIEQNDGADDERHEATQPQRAKSWHVEFGDDHTHPQHDECKPRVVHRENLQGEQREHQGYDPDDARKHHAWIVALQEQPVEADQEKSVCNRGMGNDRQELGAPVGVDALDRKTRSRKLHRPIRNLHFAAVDLCQEVGHIARDDIDHMHFERSTRGETRGAAYRQLRPLNIATTQLS